MTDDTTSVEIGIWCRLLEEKQDLLTEVERLRERNLQLNKQLGAYMRFQLWVQEYHNEIHDSYEDVDEL
tara:strand:+ start:110 stop:316 length:207 start_codon:yes stop_codon:yes gene_type:complete